MKKMPKRTLTTPLNCPFCGEPPGIIPWHGGKQGKRMVSCENPKCYVSPQVSGDTRIMAIEKWNTRKPITGG